MTISCLLDCLLRSMVTGHLPLICLAACLSILPGQLGCGQANIACLGLIKVTFIVRVLQHCFTVNLV